MLKVQLLGGFQISWSEGPVAGFGNMRLQSLLAYLLLHRHAPQSRQSLAYLFWPESGDSQARTNLRNALHLLRNQLPQAADFLLIESQTVQWRSQSSADVDVIEISRLLQEAQAASDSSARRNALEQAVARYNGPLLPDCYDEWILPLREEWQQNYLNTVYTLIDLLAEQRDYRTAIEHAQRLLQYDALQETTYARLMQLHAALGDRATALRIYHLCRTTLDRELGVDPSPTTQAIYERLLNLEHDSPITAAAAAEPMRMATPLVGRDPAWRLLQELWGRASSGQPALLIVSGEAGIGKTRLVEGLAEWASRQGVTTAQAHCYTAGGRLAFAPIQAWLRTPALQRQLPKVAELWRGELARLLPELLTTAQSVSAASPMTETTQRRRLFEAMVHAIEQCPPPLLLVLDDIQWCDSDSLDWIEYLLRNAPQSRLLVVATQRSGESAPQDPLTNLRLRLNRTGHLHEIELARLNMAETGQLVANLTGRTATDNELAGLFVETEGNPLFIVETLRARLNGPLEQAVDKLAEVLTVPTPLPPKIQSAIESRLVRLSPEARALADVAAVIGRAFTPTLLGAATGSSEDTLVQGLDELWQQQIIRDHGIGASAVDAYDFTHDKLREVVYNTLSPMRLRLLHRRIAAALESLYPNRLESISPQIALHYERAGQRILAVSWYSRAARAAHQVSALQDALAHLDQGLTLLAGEERDAESEALELSLQMGRGALLLATRGYAAPQVEEALTRALQLCQQRGAGLIQRFQVLWGLSRYYLVKPDLDRGLAVSQQLLEIAQEQEDRELLVEAYTALGTHLFHRADLHAALAYFDQAIALYDRHQDGNHTLAYGQDPCVVSLSYGAWSCWCLGLTERAQAQTTRAIRLAEELGYPYNEAIAQTYAAVQFQFMADAPACLRQAELASAISTQHGFILWQSMADFLRGWAQTQLGQTEAGMQLMYDSAELFQSTGAELGAGYFGALLAETLGRQGQPEFGIIAMNEAFDLLARTQDRWCAAELHRIQGDLLLQLPSDESGDEATLATNRQAAQDEFTTGLQLAEAQGAGWWAARCRQSLARLTQ